MKIMLVDDEDISKKVFSAYIKHIKKQKKWLIDLTICSSVDETFRKIDHSYDGLYIDLVMPDHSGFDLIKKLIDLGNKCPIYLATAMFNVRERFPSDPIWNHIAGLLLKPYSKEELCSTLEVVQAVIKIDHEKARENKNSFI